MMIPTTLDRKAWKRWLLCPTLALLLVLSSLPVHAGEQQTEQTQTPTVTQDAGSESAEGVASGEQDELIVDEFESVQPIISQEPEAAAATDWTEEQPHEGQVLHGGYVGFKNVGSGKYLTVPYGDTAKGANIIQNNALLTPNAQEFLLEYTYNTTMDEAYFRIFSLDATGTKSYPVKSTNDHPSIANIILDEINYLYLSDRWQIERVRENYYCIYLASNPDYDDTKYALTAYGNSNGTATGNTTTSPGNVYLSPLNTLNDNQLWQICADGEPIDINGINMAEIGSPDIMIDTTQSFFYIPKGYNITLMWSISESYEHIATITPLGVVSALSPGIASVTLLIEPSNELSIYKSFYVTLPNGLYQMTSVANGMWMDLSYDRVYSGTAVQVYNNSGGSLENPSMIFKIHYLGVGLYSIRSMRKNDMGVSYSTSENEITIENIGTSHATVPHTGQWYLNTNEFGIYICAKNGGTSKTVTVPLEADSSTDLITEAYSSERRQAWEFNQVSSTASGAEMKLYVLDDLGDITVGNVYNINAWITHPADNLNGSIIPICNVAENTVLQLEGTTTAFRVIGVGEVRVDVKMPTLWGSDSKSVVVKVRYSTPSTGDWFMENASSGQYASTNGQTILGSSIIQSPFNDHAIMEWELEYVTQSYFRIKSKATGLFLTAPNSIISPVIQETLPNDRSLWKIERTSGNRYKITSKAYETTNYVLAITTSSTIGNLYLYGYVDDTNYNDEWYLNMSGDELTILAMAEENRTRGQHAEQAKDIAEQQGVNCNVIITDHISVDSVLTGMATSEVFVSRSHGGPFSIAIYSYLDNGKTVSLKASDIYNYNAGTPYVDLSGCELIIFIGCSTAADANQKSITHAAVAAGAAAAIGFGDSITVPHADEWMKAFLQAYYDINLLTYKNAKLSIVQALIAESGGNMDTCMLIPPYA